MYRHALNNANIVTPSFTAPSKNSNYRYSHIIEQAKSIDYDDFCYYKAAEDFYSSISKDGLYIRDAPSDRPIASLEPFKFCPWCAKKLKKK